MAFRNKTARNFKKGIDSEDARRKREEVSVQLRKQKRDEQLAKRRQATDAPGFGGMADQSGAVTGNNIQIQPNSQNITNVNIMDKLPELVDGVNSNDPERQKDAVICFRKFLSIERNPPIQEVINSGVVPRLTQFLTFNHNPSLQFEAAWALTNIASGTSQHTKVVIDHNAIPIFVSLLQSPNDDVREQVVWALGNIAGDSHVCRDQVLKEGALGPLIQQCQPTAKLSMLRNATWTLSNFCRGKPQPPFELVRDSLPVLTQLIKSQDEEVLIDACWALSYLSDDTGPQNQKIQAVLDASVAETLVNLLEHVSASVKTPALRTVGNIVTGDDGQTQQILGCKNFLPQVYSLLFDQKKGIRKEACWTISNITAGNPEQIQQIFDANIIPPLIQILESAEFDIQKEAAWAISNATSGGRDEQIHFLAQNNAIEPLCSMFNCPDPKMIVVAMEGVENILRVGQRTSEAENCANKYAEKVEECGGLDSLENLQTNQNEDVYNKAVRILKDYFEHEEEEEMNIAPAVSGSGDQFAFGAQQGGGGNEQFSFGGQQGQNTTQFNFN